MRKRIFLLSVLLSFLTFNSSSAETQKSFWGDNRDNDSYFQCGTTIKDTDKIIELYILNLGNKYAIFDKKQFDRLEILSEYNLYAVLPVKDEIVIINPDDPVSIKFPLPARYPGGPPIDIDKIKQIKVIFDQKNLEITLEPKKPEKKK